MRSVLHSYILPVWKARRALYPSYSCNRAARESGCPPKYLNAQTSTSLPRAITCSGLNERLPLCSSSAKYILHWHLSGEYPSCFSAWRIPYAAHFPLSQDRQTFRQLGSLRLKSKIFLLYGCKKRIRRIRLKSKP